MKIRAGFIQFTPVLGDIERNIQLLRDLLQQVRDVDIVVLPELAGTGYNFRSKQQAYDLSEQLPDGRFTSFLAESAKELQCHIVAGINEQDGHLLYNTAVLIGPEGYIGKYRKLHLFMNEKDIFEPGNTGLPVFDINGYKTGILICFDYLAPEIWRILAQKGADLICHPSNLLTQNAFISVPGHALVNRIFVITANRTGQEYELEFCGNSMVVNPKGEVICQAGGTGDAVLSCELDLDLARDKWITRRNHVFRDRRPGTYGE